MKLIGAPFAPNREPSVSEGRGWLIHVDRLLRDKPVVMECARPPVLSHLAISRLVLSYFPFKEINTSSIEEFVSYDDRNYFFRGEPLDNSLQNGYVLKLTNFNDPPEIVDGLSGITKHLHKKGYKCPYPIPVARPGSEYDDMVVLNYEQLVALEKDEVKNGDIDVAKNGAMNNYCVRVLVFVSGKLLAHVPWTPALLFKVGQYVGSLDKDLQVPIQLIIHTIL